MNGLFYGFSLLRKINTLPIIAFITVNRPNVIQVRRYFETVLRG